MGFVLKRAVTVSPDPDHPDYQPGRVVTIAAGTGLSDIFTSERDQLAPEHFEDEDGSDDLPDDWRTDEATFEHDKRQAKATAAEKKERDKARKAKRSQDQEA